MTGFPRPTITFDDGTVLAAAEGFRPVTVTGSSDGVARALAQCNELSAFVRKNQQSGSQFAVRPAVQGITTTSADAYASMESLSRRLRGDAPKT